LPVPPFSDSTAMVSAMEAADYLAARPAGHYSAIVAGGDSGTWAPATAVSRK
jgi:hypothetical protein